MKATGIVRKFDENGRFVLPMELRRQLDLLGPDAALEIFTEGDSVILKKYAPSCIFCDSMEDLGVYRDKRLCRACAKKIAAMFED